jgi:tetratricopeptide (TPR) repeat protein
MARSPDQVTASPVGDLIDRQIERHRAVLSQRPNYADLHYRLGLLLKQRGEMSEAADCFRQATEINPNYTKALIQFGLSLHDLGQTHEGIAALTRAFDTDHKSIDLHYQLGLMFADREQFATAIEQFEQALATEPRNIDFHANLALALQNMGLIDRATGTWHTLCDLALETPAGQDTIRRIERENTR